MSASGTTFSVIVFLLTAVLWPISAKANSQPPDSAASESPRAVVARWLELHRTGKRDEASGLTSGSHYHRADVLLPSTRDTGVRVAWSLGSQRSAAVVTSALNKDRDGERVLLFWLVRRDGAWLINKSDSFEKRVVDERLRGFLEAGDVRWHVRRGDLLGNWEAGPCRLPGVGGIYCGSRLQLGEDNQYRLAAWGPGGPHPEFDVVMQGKWRLDNGRLLLSHQDHTYACRVEWIADNLLIIEPPNEHGDVKDRARYERADAAQDQPGPAE